jgi:hypothetical protein
LKIAPVDKYMLLQANITAIFTSGGTDQSVPMGQTDYAVPTDVATLKFLSELYNIPPGM